MEWLAAKVGVSAVQWSIGGIAGLGVAWALKRIPNRKLKANFGLFMYRLGIASTPGLGKWKITKRLSLILLMLLIILSDMVLKNTSEG